MARILHRKGSREGAEDLAVVARTRAPDVDAVLKVGFRRQTVNIIFLVFYLLDSSRLATDGIHLAISGKRGGC
jgi:hypothetical protein